MDSLGHDQLLSARRNAYWLTQQETDANDGKNVWEQVRFYFTLACEFSFWFVCEQFESNFP